MTKINTIPGIIMLISLFLTGCQEDINDRYLLTENAIEFEEAITNTVAVGKTYPIINKTIKDVNEPINLQVNLLGESHSEDLSLTFKVVEEESTAVQGEDFKLTQGNSFTFTNKSHKSFIEVEPTTNGNGIKVLVLELIGNDKVKASQNYKKLGLKLIYP